MLDTLFGWGVWDTSVCTVWGASAPVPYFCVEEF